MSEEVDSITRELNTLTSLELLCLLDNISEQILTILIQRNELLEDMQDATHWEEGMREPVTVDVVMGTLQDYMMQPEFGSIKTKKMKEEIAEAIRVIDMYAYDLDIDPTKLLPSKWVIQNPSS